MDKNRFELVRNFTQNINWLFPIFSGSIVITCVVYCAMWWKPHPMTILDVDCSIVCWNFCRTMSNTWASIAILVAAISILSGILFKLKNKYATVLSLFSGILTLPVGIMTLFPLLLNLFSKHKD